MERLELARLPALYEELCGFDCCCWVCCCCLELKAAATAAARAAVLEADVDREMWEELSGVEVKFRNWEYAEGLEVSSFGPLEE